MPIFDSRFDDRATDRRAAARWGCAREKDAIMKFEKDGPNAKCVVKWSVQESKWIEDLLDLPPCVPIPSSCSHANFE